MDSFIWHEDAKQLGFQVTLPDGREISVDLKKVPVKVGASPSVTTDGVILAQGSYTVAAEVAHD